MFLLFKRVIYSLKTVMKELVNVQKRQCSWAWPWRRPINSKWREWSNVLRVRNHLLLLFFSLSFLDSNDDIEANLDSNVELEDKNRQKSGKSNVCTCTVCLLEENQFMTVGIECRSFRLQVVSPTLRSIRLYDQSRFAYTVALEDR